MPTLCARTSMNRLFRSTIFCHHSVAAFFDCSSSCGSIQRTPLTRAPKPSVAGTSPRVQQRSPAAPFPADRCGPPHHRRPVHIGRAVMKFGIRKARGSGRGLPQRRTGSSMCAALPSAHRAVCSLVRCRGRQRRRCRDLAFGRAHVQTRTGGSSTLADQRSEGEPARAAGMTGTRKMSLHRRG
jgi:hypothetical protein